VQFLVVGRDGTDPDAPARRQAAREAHIAGARTMKAAGTLIVGAALLDDDGAMVGSMMLVDFPSRAALDAWLRRDPYVTGDVWQSIEITPSRVTV
jgi:hypothetical protein